MPRILVVHENNSVSGLFKAILKENHDVEMVSSCKEGLEKVEAEEYRVVFVQGSLIWLYGNELIEKCRAPVVMVSGGEKKSFSKLAKETGCRAFIPLPTKNLARKLRKLANKFS